MKAPTKVRLRFRIAGGMALAAMLIQGSVLPASAWQTVDAIKAFDDYNRAMYFVKAGDHGYYRVAQGSDNVDSFWHFAEEIEMVEDAILLTNSVTYKNMIKQLCTGFTTHNGTDWFGNKFNDDLMWGAIAFARAYDATGNRSYLTIAEKNFDTAYDRGWDTVSGGMWQTTGKDSKNACVNFPAAIAGCCIYNAGGGPAYLTKARNNYNWGKANFFDATTGKVSDSTISANHFLIIRGRASGQRIFWVITAHAPLRRITP